MRVAAAATQETTAACTCSAADTHRAMDTEQRIFIRMAFGNGDVVFWGLRCETTTP